MNLLFVVLALLPIDDLPESDAMRFPGQEVTMNNWIMARDHVLCLKNCPERFFPDYDDWLADAEYCRRAWDLLDNVQRGFGCKRTQLALLRDHLGYKAYYSSWMPPPVPVWRFRRID